MARRPLGNLMFEVEDVVLVLAYRQRWSWAKILRAVYQILEEDHLKAQEEYVAGGSPRLRLSPVLSSRRVPKKLRRVVAEMCTEQKLQWYEVLYLFYGYLQVHCPNRKDAKFKFYYGA